MSEETNDVETVAVPVEETTEESTPAEVEDEGKPVGPATIVDGETMGDQFPLHDANL